MNQQKKETYKQKEKETQSVKLKQSKISARSQLPSLQLLSQRMKSRSLKAEDLDKNVYLQEIDNTKAQINSLLDQLNNRLVNNYQNKQKQLLQKYKDQLITAHKNLMHLKNNTNQQQIRNEMNQRKLQLQKQRLQLIQNNMYFSNKCEQLKKILQNEITQGAQLKKQIEFLDKQLQISASKKVELLGRLYQKNNALVKNYPQEKYKTGQLPLFSQKKLPSTEKKASLSTYSNTENLIPSKSNSQSKLKKSITKPLFSNDVKKLFQDKLKGSNQNMDLEYSDNLIKVGKSFTKRSIITKQKSGLDQSKKREIGQIFKQIVSEIKKKNFNPTKQEVLIMKGEQFTPIEKKLIMKTFLQNQEVKKQLYSIIFDKLQQNQFPMTLRKKSKIKIAYQDTIQKAKTQQKLQE